MERVERLPVPPAYRAWTASWAEYCPPQFTAPHVDAAVWADPDLAEPGFSPRWNTLDGNVSSAVLWLTSPW